MAPKELADKILKGEAVGLQSGGHLYLCEVSQELAKMGYKRVKIIYMNGKIMETLIFPNKYVEGEIGKNKIKTL